MALIKRGGDASLEKGEIFAAVRSRYPHLSKDEHERLTAELIRWIVKALQEGRNIGAFREMPNGDIEISMVALVEQAATQITK
ncbi:hypothetical protein J8N05_32295 [Streptomyces sp. BH-SS-21]|uniref:Uncharacterized protein n=1 Tax=Streptomyces liliiviolaceus TaxID=2823109 RepID=A0A941BC56_9ACTN|nr:hypothetical protein [Streptomyces liliiviolaceus]MBQ0852853.1 hypothetical protein [Streptomyces liliiviolaceus]